ncbi:MAG: class C sortase [Clostridium sp.]|nr:class C sortase [Clostridium sp.]
MRRHLTTVIFILIFLAGLSLILYPTVSDRWNQMHQSRAITGYAEATASLDDEDYMKILSDAHAYNEELAEIGGAVELPEAWEERYEAQLNIGGQGVMGYIEIPKIDCRLPIYHGTSEGVLQTAIGHLEGSSLPVGGESVHSVLSGHRGLPSARLFTDLDRMAEGDIFLLCVLDEVMTYEIDQILVVLPEETEALAIVPGEDLCTLVTCTPYGVNSHRMLVRGRRIEQQTAQETVRITADAVQIETPLVVSAAAAPMLVLFLIALVYRACRAKNMRKKERARNERNEPE